MNIKPPPVWIAGGFLLTTLAGFVNATSFVGLYHQSISHATGNVTRLSEEIINGNKTEVMSLSFVLLSFLLGSIISGIVTGSSSLKSGRRYGILMMLEGSLLALSGWMLNQQIMYGEYVASMACGIQNSMATSYSGAVIRTTHMTGTITDIGILLGRLIRYGKTEYWQLFLYTILLIGFFFGGIFGFLFFTILKFSALYLPATVIATAGAFYFIWRMRNLRIHGN